MPDLWKCLKCYKVYIYRKDDPQCPRCAIRKREGLKPEQKNHSDPVYVYGK